MGESRYTGLLAAKCRWHSYYNSLDVVVPVGRLVSQLFHRGANGAEMVLTLFRDNFGNNVRSHIRSHHSGSSKAPQNTSMIYCRLGIALIQLQPSSKCCTIDAALPSGAPGCLQDTLLLYAHSAL